MVTVVTVMHVDSLAIIGLGDIGLLPLQVASVPAGLSIRILPSARALDLSLAQKTADNTKRLLTVSDPVSDRFCSLPFSRIESFVFKVAFLRGTDSQSIRCRSIAGQCTTMAA